MHLKVLEVTWEAKANARETFWHVWNMHNNHKEHVKTLENVFEFWRNCEFWYGFSGLVWLFKKNRTARNFKFDWFFRELKIFQVGIWVKHELMRACKNLILCAMTD